MTATVELGALAEPSNWKRAWWDAERAGTSPPDLVEAVAARAWAAWETPLAASGHDKGWLAAVAAGYRRELWLWLVGERTWEQASEGLAGRVGRRLT